jgi:DUF4097 and DUF4098 domain-containing protein YvlB
MRAILLPVLALAACTQPGFVAKKSVDLSIPAAGVGTIACTSHNGEIAVQGDAAANEIGVHAELSVRGYTQDEADANLKQMSVDQEVANGTLKLIGKYDTAALMNRSPSFAFHLKTPRQVALQLESHNGSIHAEGTQGTVALLSHNGEIIGKVATARVNAETHNGSVRLDLANQGRLDGEIVSHNGNIVVALGEGIGTAVTASTHNGDVTAARLQDATVSRQNVSGRVGDGSGRLSITTHNGDVTIR